MGERDPMDEAATAYSPAMPDTEHSGSPRQFELGERIRKQRNEADLSQEALALKAGISRTQLTSSKRGEATRLFIPSLNSPLS